MPSVSTEPLAAARRARARLHRALGAWFLREARDLPWRRTRDPYAIWISEAMLQQTRVEVVIPYWQRFLQRFPDVGALARAREEEVLELWSGLGYYSRARALRAAAGRIVAGHDGAFPRTREGWLALPGVGPYTAGAVLSIAFERPEALVDGNVQRVLARLFALQATRGSSALASTCWELARVLVPEPSEEPGPGGWNQALMELGALVCLPRAPSCERCPLRTSCRARASGSAEELPRASPRARPIPVELEVLVVRSEGRFLCVRRPAGGRMAGLLELPTRELVPVAGEARLWPRQLAFELPGGARTALGSVSHSITRHRIRAAVVGLSTHGASTRGFSAPSGARWLRADELAGAALTGLTRKVLALPAVRASAGPDGVRARRAASGARK